MCKSTVQRDVEVAVRCNPTVMAGAILAARGLHSNHDCPRAAVFLES